ncbi:hypothetical protein AXF42_Ash021511 [Apostasia shenzhenica]|uniref:Uncharacterized protein n=1 Tax=Apostasia shenzhenica TaxID=1088818 RepID=A0A2H9ZYG1_9ASPA|nr:hypothetical protein AXF42_Ash021511 [Apostasia shenzhenica]
MQFGGISSPRDTSTCSLTCGTHCPLNPSRPHRCPVRAALPGLLGFWAHVWALSLWALKQPIPLELNSQRAQLPGLGPIYHTTGLWAQPHGLGQSESWAPARLLLGWPNLNCPPHLNSSPLYSPTLGPYKTLALGLGPG